MKKVIFRSLIVGLFAVVSLNASAQWVNWQFWNWMQPAQFHVSGVWLEPNTSFDFQFYPFEQITPVQSWQGGDLVMVSWFYSITNGLLPGDRVLVIGNGQECEYYIATCTFGTGFSGPQKALPVCSDGSLTVRIIAGDYAGNRTIGPYGGPIVSYPVSWVGDPSWGEFVVWTGIWSGY